MENSFGRYFMTQKTKCKLYLHPTNLPLSQYGLVLRKGSPLTQEISEVIIKLRERGILNVFYKRWIDSTCERQKWGKTEKLHLHFFKKVFLVLVSAVFLSIMIIILEFWYQKMSKKYDLNCMYEPRDLQGHLEENEVLKKWLKPPERELSRWFEASSKFEEEV